MAAMAAMSLISKVGLLGLSKKSVLVLGRIAAFQAATSVESTSVTSIPKRGMKVSITQRQDEKRAFPATT